MADGTCSRCSARLEPGLLGGRCPACLLAMVATEEDFQPERFGEYLLEEEIGRGGMGVVFRAWHPPLGRHVALKILVGGVFARPDFLRRFRMESLAAAQLHHPSIVTVHEAGEAEGQAFYTMELVEGGTLGDLVSAGTPLPATRAAELLEKIARAVAYAHECGVLHRDLKPSNVLLTKDGQPQIADFGLARLLEESGDSNFTLTAELLGSPPYMSPEMASGGGASRASDLFALGAMLYELLTARPPYTGQNSQAVLERARAGDVVSPRALQAGLPRDVETICLKCLEREPGKRYGSAADLADDLRRFLDGREVLARPVGPAGRLARWARRNRTLAGLGAALAISLVIGTVAVIAQAGVNLRQAAELSREQAESAVTRETLAANLYAADLRAAAQEIASGNPEGARRWLEAHEADPQRGVELGWLMREARPRNVITLAAFKAQVRSVAYAPDGSRIAVGIMGGPLAVVDRQGGVAEIPGAVHPAAPFVTEHGVEFCADGFFQTVTGETAARRFPARRISFSRDRTRCVTLDADPMFFYREGGRARLVDPGDGSHLWELPGENFSDARLSPDGTLLATTDDTGKVVLWDVAARSRKADWDLPGVTCLDFSPDGRLLAAGGRDLAWLLPTAGGGPRVLYHAPGHQITALAFSPAGDRLATACTDRALRIWATENAIAQAVLRGHRSEVWAVAWHPGGRALASGCKDGEVREWQVAENEGPVVIPRGSFARPVFDESGKSLITGDGYLPDTVVTRWQAPDGGPLQGFPPGTLLIGSRGQEAVLWNTRTRRVEWWPFGAEQPRQSIEPHQARTRFSYQMALSPDGRTLAVLDDDGTVIFQPVAGGPVRRMPLCPERRDGWKFRAFSWDPSGTQVAAATEEAPFGIRIADLATNEVKTLANEKNYITGLAFSPDGRWLAGGSVDGEIAVWDRATVQLHRRWTGHDRNTGDLVFAPDSRTLLSLGGLEGVKFWHVRTWRQLALLPVPDAFHHLSISPDGSAIAVTCGEGGEDVYLRVFPLR